MLEAGVVPAYRVAAWRNAPWSRPATRSMMPSASSRDVAGSPASAAPIVAASASSRAAPSKLRRRSSSVAVDPAPGRATASPAGSSNASDSASAATASPCPSRTRRRLSWAASRDDQCSPSRTAGRWRSRLDDALERLRRRHRHERAVVARSVRAQRRGLPLHAGGDRVAGVVAAELADLPLASEHPQRIGDPGLDSGVELVVVRRALDAIPRADHDATSTTAALSNRPGAKHVGRAWP